jgi:POT family proton-dependent oligopeptide transporter
MVLELLFSISLKNKYVVTPEGRPIGGLPKPNDAGDYEEGEVAKSKIFSGIKQL